MLKEHDLKKRLKTLFATQRFGVVATPMKGHPYTSLVAVTATNDLRSLIFATLRTSTKYANLVDDPRVAMLIDSRANAPSDLSKAVAVTAVGRVRFSEENTDRLLSRHLQKHPYLTDFLEYPDCALVRIDVERYYVVSHFQEVHVWEVRA